MAILFALLALLGWGVGDLFGTLSSRKIGSVYNIFWMLVIALILSSLYLPFAGPIASWPMFIFSILLNLIDLYGTLMFFRALEIGNASLVGAITGSFGFISAILSIIIFGESINIIQAIGIIFALAGVILSSIKIAEIKSKKLGLTLSEPYIKYALITLGIWGVYYTLLRIPVKSIGWFWTDYSWNFFFVVLIFMGKIKKDVFRVLKDKKSIIIVFLFAIFVNTGVFAYNLGISTGFTSVVAPIAASSSVLFVILSGIFFREELTGQQKVGIVSSLIGILLISFASG